MGSHGPTRSAPSLVQLVPWDPESPNHVQRMVDQRIACGWKQDYVEKWRGLQKEGKIALQWIILNESDPSHESKIETHVSAYPKEKLSLQDTATSLGGKPRTSDGSKEFVPIGHISLDKEYESPGYVDSQEGLYIIATFYVSGVLQGMGLGRAAMDTIEEMATSEPLCARTLALSTVAKDYEGRAEKLAALGLGPPAVENQDWYERRGYKVFRKVEKMWFDLDKEGRKWYSTAVLMKKDIS